MNTSILPVLDDINSLTTHVKHAPVEPVELRPLGERLLLAIERLEAFGVATSQGSRLRAAYNAISDVVLANAFPVASADFTELVNAIELAEDFSAITAALPKTNSAEFRRQLRHAVRGTLAASDADREPFRYQSQFWIGTILSSAKLNPRLVRDTSRENPDFIIQPLTSDYGVEVKRPMYEWNIQANVEKAASQLASFSVSGLVLVDVTDCIRSRPMAEFRHEVWRLSEEIDHQIWDDVSEKHRSGFRHVFMSAAYARGAWLLREGASPTIGRENYFCSTLFRYGRTASSYAAEHIHDAMQVAIAGTDFSVVVGRR